MMIRVARPSRTTTTTSTQRAHTPTYCNTSSFSHASHTTFIHTHATGARLVVGVVKLQRNFATANNTEKKKAATAKHDVEDITDIESTENDNNNDSKATEGKDQKKKKMIKLSDKEKSGSGVERVVRERDPAKDLPDEKKIIETGDIYFFYRPRVGLTTAQSLEDVQKFYMLLCPQKPKSGEASVEGGFSSSSAGSAGAELESQPNRVITVPKKRLPVAHASNRYWGFIDSVDHTFEKITKMLEEEKYTTKKEQKTNPACQPVGEGLYALVHHQSKGRTHVHLTYILESPKELGQVQQDFNILKEGSYILSVKNPDHQTPEGRPAFHDKWKADIPDSLKQQEFGEKARFVSSPLFLNYERTEIIIIGSSGDLEKEFADVGVEGSEESCSVTTSKLVQELKELQKNPNRVKPIKTGTAE